MIRSGSARLKDRPHHNTTPGANPLPYPLAVLGISLFAWRLTPRSLLVAVAALSAAWTLEQGYVHVTPRDARVPAAEVEGFLYTRQKLEFRSFEILDGVATPRGMARSHQYYLKGKRGVRHRELLAARFENPRPVVADTDAFGPPHHDEFQPVAFAAPPAHAVALASTCWFGSTRIVWVVSDRAVEVGAAMTVEAFAAANPAGRFALMTVEMKDR